ncbi:MAG: hypothetical protein FWG14_10405 [Peptococcaceae bacterium]|nr:hypothetical protein [Peptococcaceae bacterium]
MKNLREWQMKNLTDALRWLSDANTQEKSWILHEGQYIPVFSELICQLFDDTGLQDIIDENILENFFPEDVCAYIYSLNKAVSQVNQSLPLNEMLNSPEMLVLRYEANRLLLALPPKPV